MPAGTTEASTTESWPQQLPSQQAVVARNEQAGRACGLCPAGTRLAGRSALPRLPGPPPPLTHYPPTWPPAPPRSPPALPV